MDVYISLGCVAEALKIQERPIYVLKKLTSIISPERYLNSQILSN